MSSPRPLNELPHKYWYKRRTYSAIQFRPSCLIYYRIVWSYTDRSCSCGVQTVTEELFCICYKNTCIFLPIIQRVKLADTKVDEGSLLASQMYSPLSAASTLLIVRVLLDTGPPDELASWWVTDTRGLLIMCILSVVLFIHVIIAGGLAVALHSMSTVSSLAGMLLFPLTTKLLQVRGTTNNKNESISTPLSLWVSTY